VRKRLVRSAALTRAVAVCLVLLQLIVSIGLGMAFAVAADDFGAPSAVVNALLALGLAIGVWALLARHPRSRMLLRDPLAASQEPAGVTAQARRHREMLGQRLGGLALGAV
jgi:hypothetical protein